MYDAALPHFKKLISKCKGREPVRTFGRFNRGTIGETPEGVRVFFVIRRARQMYCGDEPGQTAALQKDVAAWMMNLELLRFLKRKKIDCIAFCVRDTGEMYLSMMTKWLDKSITRDAQLKVWGNVRLLGIRHMHKRVYYTRKLLTHV